MFVIIVNSHHKCCVIFARVPMLHILSNDRTRLSLLVHLVDGVLTVDIGVPCDISFVSVKSTYIVSADPPSS